MVDHEVPWHERLGCQNCPREFYGACAFDAHRPCKSGTWERLNNETWVVTSRNGGERAVFKNIPGGPFVLADEWDKFNEMQARAEKARAGRA